MLFQEEKDLLFETMIREMTYGLDPSSTEEIISNWHAIEVYDEDIK